MATPIPSMTGGAGGAAGPSTSGGNSTGFDASDWVVNFGSGSVSTAGGAQYMPYVLAAVAAVALWRLVK